MNHRLYRPPRISWAPPCLKHPRPRWLISWPPPRVSQFSTTAYITTTPAPPNNYETLKLPPNCTHADLKKQFYILSKETHPDLNPGDPKASERFTQVSESYSVLADPEKRKRYDRDILRYKQSHSRRVSTRTAIRRPRPRIKLRPICVLVEEGQLTPVPQQASTAPFMVRRMPTFRTSSIRPVRSGRKHMKIRGGLDV